MDHATESGARAALEALEAWRAAVGTAELLELASPTNPTWLVTAEDGQRYVLKPLPEFPPGVGPVDEFRVVAYLQKVGILVVLPIVTDEGEIHARVDERTYALMPYVPHDECNHELGPDARTVARAIGAAIGDVDRALADCPWRVPSYVDDPVSQVFGESLPNLPDEITRAVAPHVEHLRTAMTDLPTQRTVGDCNAGNVLVRNREVVAFIDLDHLPLGPRARDLAYYLASRLRAHLGRSVISWICAHWTI
ncbi:MAG TPA: phosphotransferase [Actinopolymorphaceae bacterium]